MKVTRTYSIEESIFQAFDHLTTERNINKSSFIEEAIKKYLKDNDMDFIDKSYCLKTNPNHIVTVLAQDQSYYQLSDGSKINKILFMSIFDEFKPIDPNEFFKSHEKLNEKLSEGMINYLKNKEIDEIKYSTNIHVNQDPISINDEWISEKEKKCYYEFGKVKESIIEELIKNNPKSSCWTKSDPQEIEKVLEHISQNNLDFPELQAKVGELKEKIKNL